MEEAQKEYYCTRKNGIYLEYLQTLSEKDILPGVQEFLEAARAKGYRTALGSASKNAVFILEKLKLSESFDAVIDGNKVSKAKPDPEVFLNGAAALGLAGCDCIVFEDAISGIESARRAGAGKIIAVASFEPRETYQSNSAVSQIIEDFDQFDAQKWLKSMD